MRTSSVLRARMWLFPLLLLSLTRGDQAADPAAALAPAHPARAAAPGQIGQKKVSETYGKVPINFEANEGQTDGEVKFLSRAIGYSLFLTSTEAVFALRRPAKHKAGENAFAKRIGVQAEALNHHPL